MLRNQHSFSRCDRLKLIAAYANKLQSKNDAQDLVDELLGFIKRQATQSIDH